MTHNSVEAGSTPERSAAAAGAGRKPEAGSFRLVW